MRMRAAKGEVLATILVLTLLPAILFPAPLVAVDVKPDLTFTYKCLSWFLMDLKSAKIVTEMVSKIGVKFELQPLDSHILYPQVENKEFEVNSVSQGQGPSPRDPLELYHSSGDYPGGPNDTGIRNATLDEYLEKAYTEMDMEKRKEYLGMVQYILAEQIPCIPIFVGDETHVIRSEWEGYVVMPGGIMDVNNIWTLLGLHDTTPGVEEQVFVMALPSYIGGFNMLDHRDWRTWYVVTLLAYDTLLKYDPELNIIPWLAKEYSISPDGKTYTFKLHENAVWHDGEPLTAEDVKFTLEYMKEQKVPYIYEDVKHITSVETPDPYTVIVHLDTSFWLLEHDFAMDIPILPKHLWEDKPWDWDNIVPGGNLIGGDLIGSGPFMLKKHVEGEYLEFWRNDNWWYPQKPILDKYIFKVLRTQEARLMAMKKGEVDTERYETPPSLIPEVVADPNLKLVPSTGIWMVNVEFNIREGPLSDVWVRRAIAHAINKQEIVDRVMLGWGKVANSVLPKCWYPQYYNPDIPIYEYNVTKANQILEEHGYIDVDGDGVRELPGAKPPVAPWYTSPIAQVGIIAAIVIVAVVVGAALYVRSVKKAMAAREG